MINEALKREILGESTSISPYIKPIQAFTWRVGTRDGNRSELAGLTGAFVRAMSWWDKEDVETALTAILARLKPEDKAEFMKLKADALEAVSTQDHPNAIDPRHPHPDQTMKWDGSRWTEAKNELADRTKCDACHHPLPVHHKDGCHMGDGCECKKTPEQVAKKESLKRELMGEEPSERDCMRCEKTFKDNGDNDYCKDCRGSDDKKIAAAGFKGAAGAKKESLKREWLMREAGELCQSCGHAWGVHSFDFYGGSGTCRGQIGPNPCPCLGFAETKAALLKRLMNEAAPKKGTEMMDEECDECGQKANAAKGKVFAFQWEGKEPHCHQKCMNALYSDTKDESLGEAEDTDTCMSCPHDYDNHKKPNGDRSCKVCDCKKFVPNRAKKESLKRELEADARQGHGLLPDKFFGDDDPEKELKKPSQARATLDVITAGNKIFADNSGYKTDSSLPAGYPYPTSMKKKESLMRDLMGEVSSWEEREKGSKCASCNHASGWHTKKAVSVPADINTRAFNYVPGNCMWSNGREDPDDRMFCNCKKFVEPKKESLKRELEAVVMTTDQGTFQGTLGSDDVIRRDNCPTCGENMANHEPGVDWTQCRDKRYAKKKESKEKPMKTKPASEAAYHSVANAAIKMMVRIQESPRMGRVTPLLARLDKVANKAADSVAATMMGEGPGYTFPELFKELKDVTKSLKNTMGEGWIMYPALGVGNDFSTGSDGREIDPTLSGVDPVGGMVAAAVPYSGASLESVNKYVDGLLKEADEKCDTCGGVDKHDKDKHDADFKEK